MNKILNILFALSLAAMTSCSGEKEYPWNPAWDEFGVVSEDDIPVIADEDKQRLVWIDASANFQFYANNAKNIEADMKRLKETGFTGVIVEVRPTVGGVLFKTDYEAALDKVDAWVGGTYQWVQRTADFDYLQAFIDAGKSEGLDVYAAINTMIGGKYCGLANGKHGPLYDDPQKKDWACVINKKSGLINTLEDGTGTKFMNPADERVVNYLLGIIEDLAAYDVKGIILDRCRYDDNDLMSDFSQTSRTKFEEFIGKKITNWPDDVFAPGQDKLSNPVTDMQKDWIAFRAKNIHDFIVRASNKVHSVNRKMQFGAYVGAWYSTYYNSGVNWASPEYNTSRVFNWARADYSQYGYADHCDIMIIGAYAGVKNVYGSSEWTMEGFCKRAENYFRGDVAFIGGPDIGNSTGFENGGQGALMPDIVKACLGASTGGMFFFDLCHIRMYDYWDDIKDAFDKVK